MNLPFCFLHHQYTAVAFNLEWVYSWGADSEYSNISDFPKKYAYFNVSEVSKFYCVLCSLISEMIFRSLLALNVIGKE